jgi:hypothetical protein
MILIVKGESTWMPPRADNEDCTHRELYACLQARQYIPHVHCPACGAIGELTIRNSRCYGCSLCYKSSPESQGEK